MAQPILGPRLRRTFVQKIKATPEQVFPLPCPELEKSWLPGWSYRMIHSRSGVVEHGAVFETDHADGKTLWIVTEHDLNRRVAFARWQPDGLLVHIEISLGQHHAEEATAVCISYTYTACNEQGVAALAGHTEDAWTRMMDFWERSMNEWLAARRPAATSVA
jgi:hypothetical protein